MSEEKKRKKIKKKIMAFMREMQWLFECGNFDRTITYMKENDGGCLAEVKYEEDYQRLNVKIYPRFFESSPEDQRKALLHELCHTFTIPLSCIGKELVRGTFHSEKEISFAHERAASKIENILDGFLQGKYRFAKDAYKNYL